MNNMKTEVIFALIAVIGTLALYLLGQEEMAIGFFPIVWAIYERFTKEEVKEDFKQAQGKTIKSWRVENKK